MDPGAFPWGCIPMDVMNPSMERFQDEYSHSGQKATCNEYYDEGSAAEKLYGVGKVPTWPWSIEPARGRRILDQKIDPTFQDGTSPPGEFSRAFSSTSVVSTIQSTEAGGSRSSVWFKNGPLHALLHL